MQRSGKGKIRKTFLLAAVFFAAGIPAWFMNTVYGYLPVIFLAVLLVLSRVFLHMLGNGISLKAGDFDTQCERGKAVNAKLSVVSHSVFLCPKAVIRFFASDISGEKEPLSQMVLTLAARSENGVCFDLVMPHIGVYTVGIREIELYDFFGISEKRILLNGEFSVTVFPKIRDPEEMAVPETAMAEAVRETRTKVPGGTDYIGVREYEQGDSMKQIHWKLSAHSREYMTKIYESNREISFSVLLDFAAYRNEDMEELMELNDCLIETALSLQEEIRRRHALHALVYCDRAGQMRRERISGRAEYGDLIRDFAMIHPQPDFQTFGFPDAAFLLEQELKGGGSSDLFLVTSRVTEELVQKILQAVRLEKRAQLYYVIPARLNSRERENLRKPLVVLEEAGIPYDFISTEENQKAHSW